MAEVKGGDKMTLHLAKIVQDVKKGATVDVGFLENATYPDGTPVAMVAAVNEFGAPSRGQPPRPFFRNMIAEKSEQWPGLIAERLKANNYDGKKTLSQVGEGIKGQLQASITSFSGVALAPSTIKAKGFSTPLIDTSVMLNSVDFIVKS